MKDFKNSFVYTVIFVFVLAFFFVALLGLTREATADQVKANEEVSSKSSILKAFHIPFKKNDVADIQAQFQKYQVEVKYFQQAGAGYQPLTEAQVEALKAAKSGNFVTVYSAQIDGLKYWAKTFVGYGLWGAVPGVMAFNEDLTRLAGFEPYPGQHSETPGLGGRIEESWFKDQFKGEKVVGGRILVKKIGEGAAPDPKNKDDGIVDGITGATLTGDGMTRAVAAEIKTMKLILGVQ